MTGPSPGPEGGGDPKGSEESESPRWCAEENCRRRSFFGYVGGKPIFCSQHSKTREGMVDVSSRRCEAVGCAKWPLYGNEGEKAKFCSLHKSSAMIDVRSRRCAASDCKRQPSYGFEGKRACFCAAHKEEGMVDVVSRRCEKPNCRRRPLYGYEGQKSQFCSAHKQEGQVDVCNRRCQRPGCSKRPCFGLPGQRPCFCGSHRSPEMVDVISHKCAYPGCSHPTGHEGNRMRSKFCDKHKSVGLAGASLLQLASTATEDSTQATIKPSAGQDAAKPPTPRSGQESGRGGDNRARSGGSTKAGREQAGSGADSAGRRASHSGTEPPTIDAQDEPRRRFSMPTPLLPSVQSLLEGNPRGRFKRHREEDGIRPKDLDTDVVSSILATPPASAEESGHLDFADIAAGSDAERGNPAPGRPDGGGSHSGGTAITEGGHGGASGVADVALAHPRPPNKASRLFSRSPQAGKQLDGGWATRSKIWNSSPPLASTGFMTTSPSPHWRQLGLASLGRAASFDEARAVASVRGLSTEDSSAPRRASAFVNHGSAVPPMVTEVGRRVSAVESRRMPAPGLAPHYSDVLSAKAPMRFVTGYSGYPGCYPLSSLTNPGARIEEEGDLDSANASTASSSSGLVSGAGIPGEGSGGAPNAQPVPSSLATPMYHMMPWTHAFTADLSSPSSGEAPPKMSSPAQGEALGGGWCSSLLEKGSSGPPQKEGGGTRLVPAWGAPRNDGDGRADGVADKKSGAGNRRASMVAIGGGGDESGGIFGVDHVSGRPPRHGSMNLPPQAGPQASQRRRWTVAGTSDNDGKASAAAARAFAPASGIAGEGAEAGESTARQGSGLADGCAPRRGAFRLFGGGGGVSGSRSGSEGGLQSPRSGASATGTPRGAEVQGGVPSGSRGWSVMNQWSPPPDQYRPTNSAIVYPSWGQAVEDSAAEEPSATSSKTSVLHSNANAGVGSSRRDSMAIRPGRYFPEPADGSSSLAETTERSGRSAPPGGMGSSTYPQAARRGFMVAHGPAATSSRRRGSVVAAGVGTLTASGEGMPQGRHGGDERHCKFGSFEEQSAKAAGDTKPMEIARRQQQQ